MEEQTAQRQGRFRSLLQEKSFVRFVIVLPFIGKNLFVLAFGGEYTIFAGLEECLKFIRDYKFHSSDIDYLRSVFPDADEAFFQHLADLNMHDVEIYAVPEGLTERTRLVPFSNSIR